MLAAAPMREVYLTPRQTEVLKCVAQGLCGKEISARLDISPRTVEFHKKAIMEALQVHSTAGLTVWAIRLRLITVEEDVV